MIGMPESLGPLVGEFLAVLDEQVRLLEAAVGHLAAFSDALAGRDDPALHRLVAEADAAQERFAAIEEKRRAVCGRLAAALLWRPDETTLARLAGVLPPVERQAVEERRRRIRSLAQEVRRRHLRTAALLVECARLNRALLLGLFPALETVRTYGAAGLSPWRPGAGLLDTRS
jgi:ABC-type transporter Mla subunit MlaD